MYSCDLCTFTLAAIKACLLIGHGGADPHLQVADPHLCQHLLPIPYADRLDRPSELAHRVVKQICAVLRRRVGLRVSDHILESRYLKHTGVEREVEEAQRVLEGGVLSGEMEAKHESGYQVTVRTVLSESAEFDASWEDSNSFDLVADSWMRAATCEAI